MPSKRSDKSLVQKNAKQKNSDWVPETLHPPREEMEPSLRPEQVGRMKIEEEVVRWAVSHSIHLKELDRNWRN